MTLVRERRQQHALRLSLPPPVPAADFRHITSSSSSSSLLSSPESSSSASSNSPSVHNLSDLEKLAVLGHGCSGTIYKVRHRRSGVVYALKVLRFDEDAVSFQQQAAREAEILKRIDSPFIVKCYGVFDTDDGGDLCFLMEYMEVGSLHDALRTRQRLSEQTISGVARRVLEGLHYLHTMQIVHRDIKPSNLLININFEIKIADFGVSRVVGEAREKSESYMGTCAYMSPERFDPERWNGECSDGFAGDVWALGVVVLECHMGHFPLISPGQKPDWATLMCAICVGREKVEMPETASLEFRSFVWRCLEKDWRLRGSVEELLNHPFVTQSHNGSIEELAGYYAMDG